LAALSAVCGSALLASGAQAYSDRVKSACKSDYNSFCAAYPVDSTGMRRCLEANGKELSRRCVNAMVDEGEIPRKYRK
jgi:hypothetical protein